MKAFFQNPFPGRPYFIQFLCREMFSGRWSRVTDRQRELLTVVSVLPNCDEEFTVQEIVEESTKTLKKPFSPSHVNQMLGKLAESGLVYKNRHGRYSFAVPLLGGFIKRQQIEGVLKAL